MQVSSVFRYADMEAVYAYLAKHAAWQVRTRREKAIFIYIYVCVYMCVYIYIIILYLYVYICIYCFKLCVWVAVPTLPSTPPGRYEAKRREEKRREEKRREEKRREEKRRETC